MDGAERCSVNEANLLTGRMDVMARWRPEADWNEQNEARANVESRETDTPDQSAAGVARNEMTGGGQVLIAGCGGVRALFPRAQRRQTRVRFNE